VKNNLLKRLQYQGNLRKKEIKPVTLSGMIMLAKLKQLKKVTLLRAGLLAYNSK